MYHPLCSADLSISCSSERYDFGVMWATIMVFVYPLGIPALYYYLLKINLDDIVKVVAVNSRSDNGEVTYLEVRPSERDYATRPTSTRLVTYKALSFLYQAYEPKFWYWEIIETTRRLFFTALLVFPATANLQVVGAIFMSVIFMKLYGYYAPYEQDADDVLQEIAQYQVFFTLFRYDEYIKCVVFFLLFYTIQNVLCVCCSGLVIRTNALEGMPNINIILGGFIVFVNCVSMVCTPYLVS